MCCDREEGLIWWYILSYCMHNYTRLAYIYRVDELNEHEHEHACIWTCLLKYSNLELTNIRPWTIIYRVDLVGLDWRTCSPFNRHTGIEAWCTLTKHGMAHASKLRMRQRAMVSYFSYKSWKCAHWTSSFLPYQSWKFPIIELQVTDIIWCFRQRICLQNIVY